MYQIQCNMTIKQFKLGKVGMTFAIYATSEENAIGWVEVGMKNMGFTRGEDYEVEIQLTPEDMEKGNVQVQC